MPRNEDIEILGDVWTRVTLNAVDTISFQAKSWQIEITATAGTNAPTLTAGSYLFNQGEGATGLQLDEAFPGVPGADHVWMRGKGYPTNVCVSHA